MNDILSMTDTETEFFQIFGKRVAELRKARGLTQTELGEQIGVNQTAIGSYEIGRRRIPLSQVAPLAEALGVSVAELVELKPSANGKPGPTPKLQRQIEQVSKLPRAKQKFVTDFIETVLQQA
jgi:transcriptional regulator with XRE-family HTH domain